jgi:hypothetical protein
MLYPKLGLGKGIQCDSPFVPRFSPRFAEHCFEYVVQTGDDCKRIAAQHNVPEDRLKRVVKSKLISYYTGSDHKEHAVWFRNNGVLDTCPALVHPLDRIWICPASDIPDWIAPKAAIGLPTIKPFLLYFMQFPTMLLWVALSFVTGNLLAPCLKQAVLWQLLLFAIFPSIGSVLIWLPVFVNVGFNTSVFNVAVLASVLLRMDQFVLKVESLRQGTSSFFRFCWVCFAISWVSLGLLFFYLSVAYDPRATAMADAVSTVGVPFSCPLLGVLSFDTSACQCLAVYHLVLAVQSLVWAWKRAAPNAQVAAHLSSSSMLMLALKQTQIWLIYYISPRETAFPPKFLHFASYAESLHMFQEVLLMTTIYRGSESKISIVVYIYQLFVYKEVIVQLLSYVSLALLFTERHILFLIATCVMELIFDIDLLWRYQQQQAQVQAGANATEATHLDLCKDSSGRAESVDRAKTEKTGRWWLLLVLGLLLSTGSLYFLVFSEQLQISLLHKYHPIAVVLAGGLFAEFGGIALGLLLAASCCVFAKRMSRHWGDSGTVLNGTFLRAAPAMLNWGFIIGMQQTSCLAVGAALVFVGSTTANTTDAVLYLSAYAVTMRIASFNLKNTCYRWQNEGVDKSTEIRTHWTSIGMAWAGLGMCFISFATFGNGGESTGPVVDLRYSLPLQAIAFYVAANVAESAMWAMCYDSTSFGIREITSVFKRKDDLTTAIIWSSHAKMVFYWLLYMLPYLNESNNTGLYLLGVLSFIEVLQSYNGYLLAFAVFDCQKKRFRSERVYTCFKGLAAASVSFGVLLFITATYLSSSTDPATPSTIFAASLCFLQMPEVIINIYVIALSGYELPHAHQKENGGGEPTDINEAFLRVTNRAKPPLVGISDLSANSAAQYPQSNHDEASSSMIQKVVVL